eukprot:m.366875 g.366875  ORF g.366875 m.366875 type:complete len:67 (+) comp38123_c0_seq1:89-289(+)
MGTVRIFVPGISPPSTTHLPNCPYPAPSPTPPFLTTLAISLVNSNVTSLLRVCVCVLAFEKQTNKH